VLPSSVEAAVQVMLVQANPTFRQVIGNSYYLYERDDGSIFVSLVAPHEWTRPEFTSTFVAEVVAISDQGWTVLGNGT
jgi:hypothetical protein